MLYSYYYIYTGSFIMYDIQNKKDVAAMVLIFVTVTSILLAFIKLCGGIPNWPWIVVLAPLIFVLVIGGLVLVTIVVLFFLFVLYHKDWME